MWPILLVEVEEHLTVTVGCEGHLCRGFDGEEKDGFALSRTVDGDDHSGDDEDCDDTDADVEGDED